MVDEHGSLSTLLSHVLVAFAIEFDNEFEVRLNKTWARPFLTSIVMWSNVMRFVGGDGTTLEELGRKSRLAEDALASLVGALERWRYVDVKEDGGATVVSHRAGFGTARGIGAGTVVVPSVTGEMTQRVWAPLAGEVEERWRERLGSERIARLRGALSAVQLRAHGVMPRFLPVLGAKGFFAEPVIDTRPAEGDGDGDDELPTLLSRVLLAYTLDYEAAAPVSLPIAANLLRVAARQAVAVGELPARAGISKEAVAMSLTWLEGQGLISTEAPASGHGKVVSLTPAGLDAQRAHSIRLSDIERQWEKQLGSATVEELRSSLEGVLASASFPEALVTPPGGWRGKGRYAKLTAQFRERPRQSLPQYPMVLHRGGWPDGS